MAIGLGLELGEPGADHASRHMAHPTRIERVTSTRGGQRGPDLMTCRSCWQSRCNAEKKRTLLLHWALSFYDAADTDVVVMDRPKRPYVWSVDAG
jgi:hypothetical protein